MTVDEMLGAIDAMRLQMGWREPTPDTERLKAEAIAQVDAIAEQVRAAQDMPTLRRLLRQLDGVVPAYYRGLAALRSGEHDSCALCGGTGVYVMPIAWEDGKGETHEDETRQRCHGCNGSGKQLR